MDFNKSAKICRNKSAPYRVPSSAAVCKPQRCVVGALHAVKDLVQTSRCGCMTALFMTGLLETPGRDLSTSVLWYI